MRDEVKSLDVVRRTPPGVRELKRLLIDTSLGVKDVAPLPGCVN